MKKLKQWGAEFKQFISRGNVVDMAVAVIIGAAFGAIVTAFTNKIIKPFIDWIVWKATGGREVGLYTMLNTVYTQDADGKAIVDFSKSIYIDWGVFIMAIVDFILIALVLFLIVKMFNTLNAMRAGLTSEEKKSLKKEAKVRAKEKGISKSEAIAEIQAEREAAKAAEEAPAPAAPTTEELLAEIRDLLAAQNKKD